MWPARLLQVFQCACLRLRCFISEWAACVFVLFLIAPSIPLLQQPAVFIHLVSISLPNLTRFPHFSSSLKAAHVNQVGVLQTWDTLPTPERELACLPTVRTALKGGLMGGKGGCWGGAFQLLLHPPGHPEPWSYCNSSANLVSCINNLGSLWSSQERYEEFQIAIIQLPTARQIHLSFFLSFFSCNK